MCSLPIFYVLLLMVLWARDSGAHWMDAWARAPLR